MRVQALIACGVVLPAVLGAQVTPLDAGTFTLYANGAFAGREQFTITRVVQGGTVAIRAAATVTLGSRQIVPALLTDTLGLPTRYQRESRDSGRVVSLVVGGSDGARFTAQLNADSGRAEREVPLGPGTIVLDDNVVHQFYFLALRPPGRVPVLAPARLASSEVAVELRGERYVEIGNGSLPARHLIVTDAGGQTTDLWVDARGRVLRVAIPNRGFVAVRDEPPR